MHLSRDELQNLADAIYSKFKFVADQMGKKEFIVLRVKMALAVKPKSYQELIFIALYSPLLKPDEYAIQAVKENIIAYLALVGDDDLGQYHNEIIEMAIEYHKSTLYSSIRTGKSTTAISHDPRYCAIDSWRGFSSELYHRIPLNYDWDAIANFIITDSTEHGKALKIRTEYGHNTLVYKGVPDECSDMCKALYRNQNGTPAVFNVNDLIQNNIDCLQQRINYDSTCSIPTSGPNHLYCYCTLIKYSGYESWAR